MMKRKLLLCAVALFSAAAFALPTTADVQAAVKAGNYTQAESMMQEVVADKPQSARAHYVYAEILAHDAKFAEAAAQARRAREIDPQIKFTDPEKFRSFEQTLQREQAPATQAPSTHVQQAAPVSYPQAASGGVPGWVWGAGFAVVAFLIFRAVSRRAAANNTLATAGGGYAPQGGGYGMQPGYGQPGYGQPGFGQPGFGAAPGGGLLRTGLAAAGGVAAGMLVEKMLEGDRHNENYGGNNFGGGQAGGWDNGSAQAATELENRPIDFGSGNDWGGDAGSSGSDFTPSGDDSGGGW
jgi:hypothetical protein